MICAAPNCLRLTGPNGVLCRSHYTIIPLYLRKALLAAKRNENADAYAQARQHMIEKVSR